VAAGVQVPVPEQNATGVKVVPVQVAAAQLTVAGASAQPPEPLQAPVLPQVPLDRHCPAGAVVPAGIGAQLPSPFTLQAWQVPQGPLPQQTPSVQKPLMHWAALAQLCPFGLSAQLLVAPDPWQVSGATQSVSAVQLVLHAALEAHTKPPEHADEVGAAQVPLPVQCETGVNVDPVQEALPQETLVLAFWQCPAPSQAPVLPQGKLALGAHCPCGSVPAAGTLAQLPAVLVRLQAWQVPHCLLLQQTPSVQKFPVRQSVSAVQLWPSRFLLPQRLVIGSQMSGAWQSLSVTQAPLQAVVPLQRKGAQLIVVAGWQVPLPSQVRPEVSVVPFAGHDGEAQDVPPAYLRQAPLPSQKPSVPQVLAPWSWQVPCGSAVPFCTLVQVPGEAVSAQDWQLPVQAVVQQTDCEQKPDRHSAPVTQAWPGGLSPQDPLMQTAGEAQSASEVQEFLQTPTPHS
jgi:hypothetical protein